MIARGWRSRFGHEVLGDHGQHARRLAERPDVAREVHAPVPQRTLGDRAQRRCPASTTSRRRVDEHQRADARRVVVRVSDRDPAAERVPDDDCRLVDARSRRADRRPTARTRRSRTTRRAARQCRRSPASPARRPCSRARRSARSRRGRCAARAPSRGAGRPACRRRRRHRRRVDPGPRCACRRRPPWDRHFAAGGCGTPRESPYERVPDGRQWRGTTASAALAVVARRAL